MNNKISIYVPSRQKSGKYVYHRARIIRDTERMLSQMFGGCTTMDVQGAYCLESGEIQHERVKIAYAYAEKLSRGVLKKVRAYCAQLKRDCNQESIALEVNGNLYMV